MERQPWLQSCLFNFTPSVHYQRWDLKNELPYLFGGQLMVVPKHMHQRGREHARSSQQLRHWGQPSRVTQIVAKPELEPQSSRCHSQPEGTSYHLNLWVDSFGPRSQSYTYHAEMPGCSSNYQQPQSLVMVNMFGSTPSYS